MPKELATTCARAPVHWARILLQAVSSVCIRSHMAGVTHITKLLVEARTGRQAFIENPRVGLLLTLRVNYSVGSKKSFAIQPLLPPW